MLTNPPHLTKLNNVKRAHIDVSLCCVLLISFQIHVSKKFGFTKWNPEEFEELRAKGMLQADGVGVQYMPDHGPLDAWKKRVLKS